MSELEKSVFISYRRSSSGYLPQAIFLFLKSQGHDVFLDVSTINNGTFDTDILRQIAERQDFIIILSHGSLDRCNEPDDWLRQEIETAIRLNKNIIPIFDQGFSFKDQNHFLTGFLRKLPRYNAIETKPQSFIEDMGKLSLRFLSSPDRQNTTQTIRVLIVDDHQMFRDGLYQALAFEDDIVVVGQSDNGEDAIKQAYKLQPDVVLLDVNIPLKNGLQVTRQLNDEYSHIAIILLTAYHDKEQIVHAMRAGASAYCPKDIMPDDLIEVIRDIAQGQYVIEGERMDRNAIESWIQSSIEAMSGSYSINPEEQVIPISPREMEVLQFVTQGLSNKEIAIKLRISQQTVKNHMTSILKKLDAEDRTQAAVNAIRRGWVRLPDNSDNHNHEQDNQPNI